MRMLVLLGAGCVLNSHADEFSEASQLVRANQLPQALTKVETFLIDKPADPRMRFLKGTIQRQLGNANEAITTFTQLTQDYPELPEPYNNLAVLYAGQGQFEQARAALEMAIRTHPGFATAHENLGDVYVRLAGLAYQKALQLDPGNTSIQPKLAQLRAVLPASPTSTSQAAPTADRPAADANP